MISKAIFRRIGIHPGDAGTCVILESSELFWKYWVLKYMCRTVFLICIIARWCPWYIFYPPECIWNITSCVIETFLHDGPHNVTSSEDYTRLLFPELASRNQILPEMYLGSIYNATSMRFIAIMQCFVGKEGVGNDRFIMISKSASRTFRARSRAIRDNLDAHHMWLNPYMVRSTLLQVAGGRQTAQVPKCKLLIFR